MASVPSRGRSQFALGAMLDGARLLRGPGGAHLGVERARVLLWLFVFYGVATGRS